MHLIAVQDVTLNCSKTNISRCSSGVLLDLLSPQASTGLDSLAASAVLVGQAEAALHSTPTKLKPVGSEADGDWQVL